MTTPAGKVPIVESAKAGFEFMRANLRTVAPAAALGAVLYAGAELVGGSGPNSLLLQIVGLAFTIVYAGFLQRLALRGDKSGVLGLKLGQDELHLLSAAAVIFFFMFIIAVMGGVVLGVVLTSAFEQAGLTPEDLRGDPQAVQAQLVALLSGPHGGPVIGALVVFALGVFYLLMRLSLSAPATIGEGKIMAFSTWRWTDGNVLRIAAAFLLLMAPLFFGLSLVIGIIGGVIGGAAGAQGTLAAAPAAVRAPLLLIAAFAQLIVITPAMNGLFAHLYRGLRPADLPPQA